MADAYYRSLYFSLDSPEHLEVLGILFALPRWRQPSAIKSALRQHLKAILDGPPLGPDEVRAFVATRAPPRRAPARTQSVKRHDAARRDRRRGPWPRGVQAGRLDHAANRRPTRRGDGRPPDPEQA
jgi:hypothetical protein